MALKDPTRAVQISSALKLVLDELDVCIQKMKYCNFNKSHVIQLRKLQGLLTPQRINAIETQHREDNSDRINTEIERLQNRITQLQSQLPSQA